MQNKETYKYLAERKALMERFKVLHKEYPHGRYDRFVKLLGEEMADIVETMYKKEK